MTWYEKVFLFSFVVSCGLTAAWVYFLRRIQAGERMVAKTAFRKRGVIPGLGGVSIFLTVWLICSASLFIYKGFFASSLTLYLGLFFGTSMMLMMGMYDDLRKLGFAYKLLFQIVCAFVLYRFGFRIDFITHPFQPGSISVGVMSLPITIFWYLLITNAINLIDGLDGLATGIAITALGVFSMVTQIESSLANLLAISLFGALLGFLPFNFYPAKIFLGDAGSQVLGFFLASITLLTADKSSLAIALTLPIAILVVPLVNVILIALIRISLGRNPLKSRVGLHLHYKLIRYGVPHRTTVLVLYLVSVYFGGMALWLNQYAARSVSFWVTVTSVLFIIIIYFGMDGIKRKKL